MRKVIILCVLIITVAWISVRKQQVQVEMASLKDFKSVSNPDIRRSKEHAESSVVRNATAGSQRILFILHSDVDQSKWSPSLWWSYQHTKAGQTGC